MTTPRRTAPPPPRTAPAPATPSSPAALDLSPRKIPPVLPTTVFYAVEGFGKTTLAAHAPSPVILMARGETGYDDLLSGGLVPAVAAVNIDSHKQLLDTLDALIADPKDRKTVVLDALGGFERLTQEFICDTQFSGDWGERGFASYGKGFDTTASEWLKVLQRLEQLREKHGVSPIILAHTRIKTFKNPEGADYDHYAPDCHDKLWAATARWASNVFFGNFFVDVRQAKGADMSKKGKATGDALRVIYTERRPAFTAKNRYAMPAEIDLVGGADASFDEVWQHINRSES